jgi:CRP-like cAMP-binding protein
MKTIRRSTKSLAKIASKQEPAFDVQSFLDSAGVARTIVEFKRRATIFSQGDTTSSVMYIQKGDMKLSVISVAGKEAVVAILGPGDFLGEGGGAAAVTHGHRHGGHANQCVGHRNERNGPRSARRACSIRPIYRLHVAAQHTNRRRLDRSAL